MVADLVTAHSIAEIDDESSALLSGAQRPIVLMPRRDGAAVADAGRPAQS